MISDHRMASNETSHQFNKLPRQKGWNMKVVRTTILRWFTGIAMILMSSQTQAELLGIEIDLDLFALDGKTRLADLLGYEGERVFNIYAAFDDPDDGLAFVGGHEQGTAFQVATTGGTGFVNSPGGGDTPPLPEQAMMLASLNWDSFVTIGIKTAIPNDLYPVLLTPGTPGPNMDPWPPRSSTNMSWTVPWCHRCPGCNQYPKGCAGDYRNLRVLFMRLVVVPDETVFGDLSLGVLLGGARGTVVPASFLANCETAGPDCNENGLADGCDFESGFSDDVNKNGVPDECECPADIAPRFGSVGLEDLLAVIANWANPGGVADVNHDGTVSVKDLILVILLWGDCASPLAQIGTSQCRFH